MGAFLVVDGDPLASNFPNLPERLEHASIQDLMPEGAIEAFDVDILIRLTRLDVVELYALVPAPGDQHLGQILGSVINADRVRFAPPCHQPLQRAHHARAGNGGVDDDRQGFAHPLVEDVQRAKASPLIQRIGHKVH